MNKIFDVAPGELIESAADEFKKNANIKTPAFSDTVKTGSHRERQPHRSDWWFLRLASILYRTYKDGPVGTGSLRTYYGGRKSRGVAPHHFRRSGGKIIRLALQTLEKEGLIKKAKKGRIVTSKGEAWLNQVAQTTAQDREQKKAQRQAQKQERERIRLAQEAAEKQVTQELRKMDQRHKTGEKTGGKEKPKEKKAGDRA